jgi:long-subunit acyl-CoA synthetase (AMP-forming)
VLPGTEVRIAEDGEVLARGPHIMTGYWGKSQATQEAIREGWLHTGDLGSLDDDGYLRITGRKKELIVTAGGKNIAPVYLEGLLTQDPLIHQVMVVGDRRNYLAALIVPDPDALRAEIQRRGIVVHSPEQALVCEPVREMYRQQICERLQGLSRYEQIGNFVLLGQPFTVEGGELTAKLSLRRDVVCAKYAQQIDELYAAAAGAGRGS